MDVTFKLGDLVLVLLTVLGAAAATYLVILLARLAAAIRNINVMLESNRQHIDDTMKSLPGIAENINEITGSVRQKTEMIDSLISGGSSGSSTDTASEGSLIASLQTAIASITTIIGIFNEIKSFFSPKKRIFKMKRK